MTTPDDEEQRLAQSMAAVAAAIAARGDTALRRMGVIIPSGGRRICCACLDWSERRYHLGGAAGTALLTHGESKGWLRRAPGWREVAVTAGGREAFRRWFGVC